MAQHREGFYHTATAEGGLLRAAGRDPPGRGADRDTRESSDPARRAAHGGRSFADASQARHGISDPRSSFKVVNPAYRPWIHLKSRQSGASTHWTLPFSYPTNDANPIGLPPVPNSTPFSSYFGPAHHQPRHRKSRRAPARDTRRCACGYRGKLKKPSPATAGKLPLGQLTRTLPWGSETLPARTTFGRNCTTWTPSSRRLATIWSATARTWTVNGMGVHVEL